MFRSIVQAATLIGGISLIAYNASNPSFPGGFIVACLAGLLLGIFVGTLNSQ